MSKIENGVQLPSDQDIRNWCRACAADEQIPDLIATARAVEFATSSSVGRHERG